MLLDLTDFWFISCEELALSSTGEFHSLFSDFTKDFFCTICIYFCKKRLNVPQASQFIQAQLLAPSQASAAEPVHGAG